MATKSVSEREPLAIVGIGCRFPGGVATPAQYWQRLCEGFDAIRPVPADRWDSRLHYSPHVEAPRKIIFDQGGFVEQDLYSVDARFFGITPREAAALDPQQRLLLEVAWECCEDALIPPETLEGTATGVFVGSFGVDHGLIQQGYLNLELLDAHAATGATATMVAARLAHAFDLRGPCVTFDTACSASLVAFHYACQALWNGECEAALAGGANVMLSPTAGISPSKGRFFSPDSRSRAFDERANGYGRGEGAAIVLVKPLSAALARGDRIYALVRATGVNHDGRTAGVSLPNREAQARLLERVHTLAGGEPVQYVEAHGTGTALGDPTELEALSEGLKLSRERPLRVGSVKSNIGHLEAAAGIAGLIKATLSLANKQIPPHIGMERPNPKIAFEELGIVVPTALEPWPKHAGRARAGVNSFGYGGTNAHAVLEEAPVTPEPAKASPSDSPALFLPLSARDPTALVEVAKGTREFVRQNGDACELSDLIHTSARLRSHHHHRLAIVARDRAELERNLDALLERGASTGSARGETPYGQAPTLSFIYTGMGPQTWTMGAGLRAAFPVFAKAFSECLERLSELAGRSLFAEIESNAGNAETPDTAHAQWLNLAVQIGLTRLWSSFGVSPALLLGHSVGEIAAAHAAGALDIDDAVLIAYHRGRLQSRVEGRGGMLAVELDEARFRELAAPAAKACEIAAVNAPGSLTLAGPLPALSELQELFDAEGIFSRLLRVKVPYHSAAMDELQAEFREALAGIRPRPPKARLISTVTGAESDLLDVNYWWRNVRDPVQFARAVGQIPDGAQILLQLGPHPVLSPSLKACFAARFQNPPVVHSLQRDREEADVLLEALGSLYAHGLAMDWDRVAPRGRRVYSLPRYPWQRERHWRESEMSLAARRGSGGHVLLQQRMPSGTPTWQTDLAEGYFAYLQDHRAEDRALFPAAAYMEIGVAVHHATRAESRTRLENLNFYSALLLSEHMTERIEIRHNPANGRLTVAGRQGKSDSDPWSPLYSATISGFTPEGAQGERFEQLREGFTRVEPVPYLDRSQSYFYYGPRFRSIREFWIKEDVYVSLLELPEETNPHGDEYFIHPALLDGALQGAVILGHGILSGGNPDGILVPVTIDRFEFIKSPKTRGFCRGRVKNYSKTSLELDLAVFDESGSLCARVEGVRWTFVRTRHPPSPEETRALLFAPVAHEVEPPPPADAAGEWLLIASEERRVGDLRVALEGLGGKVTFSSIEKALRETQPVSARGVVYVAAPAAVPSSNLAVAAERETSLALALLQSLIERGGEPGTRIACVTRSAQPSPDTATMRPDQTALWGLCRAFGNETSALTTIVADVSEKPDPAEWQTLAAELCAAKPRRQLVLRGAKTFELGLDRAEIAKAKDMDEPIRRVPSTEPVSLHFEGGIETLHWVPSSRRPPGPHEVELWVEATAVNFKDLMKVTGLISDAVTRGTFLGQELGMECAGVVKRVGSAVTGVKVGDRVGAITPGCFSRYVTCDARLLTPILPGLTAEQSVVYATFTTVVRALEELARLEKGETVLIHSATGALGLAAIQYAKWRGARVFATAGTPEKRAYLTELGVERVADSRSLAFVDEVRAWSEGRGVDVVLNFLAGEARLQSLGLLATAGRFVDVGKPGGVRDAEFPARLFNTNMLFANVDLDQLLRDSPAAMRRLATRVVELFAEGCFEPLPSEVFEPDQVKAAFQRMSRAEHIGKIVIAFGDRSVALERRSAATELRPDGSYLVTGAFGGFGFTVCRWLVARGARHLVMVSRSGASSPRAAEQVRELTAMGAAITTVSADVGDPEAVGALIRRCQAELPPLAGIVHAAMVLDDGVFTAMTKERVSLVMRAKAHGACLLADATKQLPLDFFLLFSSIAGLMGGTGQANYAAANAFLDGFAHYLRGQGRPALSINWGVLSESGVVAKNPALMRLLAGQGMLGMSDEEALSGLGMVLSGSSAQIACMKLDWAAIADASGDASFATDLLRSARASEPSMASGLATLAEQLAADPQANPLERAEAAVGAVVAVVLRTSVDRLELRRPLNAAGIDSLMATELSVALFREFGMRFTVLDLLRTLSAGDIAARILEKIQSQPKVK